ncbi:DNA cytosine methyltransferase [Streptomyces lydicus]|uniref:DNA (cytosine-5-)-methyltransferase n=1 Tax=Streptomyces lydicus TaxID=47763 RepID=A0A3Q9K8D9_9ACTN|nr:DNA cytosine methyltransferase [Streptomyces lydicus]AZS71447.1 DNA cytosine methyltransferase [Streptomyces lydicus]
MAQPTDALRIGSFCTGYGGLDMAVQRVFGGSLAWVADNDPGASRILTHHHPQVSNLGDLTAVDWHDREPVDIACGGYPCQPFSSAGKRKGTADARHIWPHIARALGVLRPRIVVLENVANHLRLGFGTVLADLAALGFDARWCVVRASDVGAPHERRRLFVVATAADTPHLGHQRAGEARGRRPGPADRGDAAADTGRPGSPVREVEPDGPQRPPAERSGGEPAAAQWGRFAPAIQRWEHVTGRAAPGATDLRGRLNPPFVEWLMGLPAGHVTDVPGLTRTQQLRALGNGVVPQQAEAAIRFLAPADIGEGLWGWAA